jgi:hypothetical protein
MGPPTLDGGYINGKSIVHALAFLLVKIIVLHVNVDIAYCKLHIF